MLPPIDDHNSFYLREDGRQRPKEYFKFLKEQAADVLAPVSTRVLDIGCATGDFLYYLRSSRPDLQLTGIDLTPAFAEKARLAVSDANILIADIYTGADLPRDSFDAVFMSGVNFYFPDYEPWLRNIISLTRRSAFVFGVFNPDDLDVRATVQRSGDNLSATSWNLISRKSISNFLDDLGVGHHFTEWEIPIATPRSHADPLRSWTIETSDRHFLVINGTQIVHRFAVLQIDISQNNP